MEIDTTTQVGAEFGIHQALLDSESGLAHLIPAGARDAILTEYTMILFGRGINEKNNRGDSPLMEAIRKSDEASVFMLLMLCRNDEICLDEKDQLGQTALCLAVEVGNASIVRILIDKGADINKKGQYGIPLQIAIEEGQMTIASLILERQAGGRNQSSANLLRHRAVDVYAKRRCGYLAWNLSLDQQNPLLYLQRQKGNRCQQ